MTIRRGWVSTHSRPKAAAPNPFGDAIGKHVSTHSRPKAAAFCLFGRFLKSAVSTHSRPKAAAWLKPHDFNCKIVSTHSRPKAAAYCSMRSLIQLAFQHTAARRRLQSGLDSGRSAKVGFNTQPPEGGCRQRALGQRQLNQFQHTAARRRLRFGHTSRQAEALFQHTAARRRLRAGEVQAAQICSFNTQPPEGGCTSIYPSKSNATPFQHTAARRRLQPRPQPASAKAFTPLFR